MLRPVVGARFVVCVAWYAQAPLSVKCMLSDRCDETEISPLPCVAKVTIALLWKRAKCISIAQKKMALIIRSRTAAPRIISMSTTLVIDIISR